jgi:uncharacterized protein (TIGR03435 family)
MEVMRVCGRTMAEIAHSLDGYADRPIIDMTGIAGKFDYDVVIDLKGDSASRLASALEHLKLRLEARHSPMEILVIDHVEQPSEN